VWDAASGECLAVLGGHTGFVRSVAFSDDGRLAITGSGDDAVRVWDVDRPLFAHLRRPDRRRRLRVVDGRLPPRHLRLARRHAAQVLSCSLRIRL
jgi:WD40 repeat protein